MAWTRPLVCWLLLSAVWAWPSYAQTDVGAYQAHCPAGQTMAPDTATVVLFIDAPWPANAQLTARLRAVTLGFGQAVAQTFVPPSAVGVPGPTAWDPVPDPERGRTTQFPFLSGKLVLALGPNGRLTGARLEDPTAAEGLNEALIRAAADADSQGLYQGLERPPSGRDTVHLVIDAAPTVPEGALPLLRLRAAYFRYNSVAVLAQPPRLRHPVPGVQDTVAFEYVIGADGRAAIGSLRLLQAKYREFYDAARAAIQGARFVPARRGRCTVPQLVRQRVVFW